MKLTISTVQNIKKKKRTWDSRRVASRVPYPAVAASAAAAVAAGVDKGGGDRSRW